METGLSYVEEFDTTISTEEGSLYTTDENGENPISDNESVFYQAFGNEFAPPIASNGNGNVIDVENDFNGDLASAIASANVGDTVQLGSKVYYTSGIVIDKNIVLSGVAGSVIDGAGTGASIIHINTEASGTTIQNLEITNGNNGIFGENATNLTLQNLDINNIGVGQTIRDGQNNTGITLNKADGSLIINSRLENIGRKAIGIGDTNDTIISNVVVEDVNLGAQHAQSHDAAGVKLFNTHNITVRDSYFDDINAINIWNDTTHSTLIEGNTIEDVGDSFVKPDFNSNVGIYGIYNEKSYNSTVRYNYADAIGEFTAFSATAYTTETMTEYENDFSTFELGSTDYWSNEAAERLVAETVDPSAADFSLFSEQYYQQVNLG